MIKYIIGVAIATVIGYQSYSYELKAAADPSTQIQALILEARQARDQGDTAKATERYHQALDLALTYSNSFP